MFSPTLIELDLRRRKGFRFLYSSSLLFDYLLYEYFYGFYGENKCADAPIPFGRLTFRVLRTFSTPYVERSLKVRLSPIRPPSDSNGKLKFNRFSAEDSVYESRKREQPFMFRLFPILLSQVVSDSARGTLFNWSFRP